eukprot:gene22807-28972_t
MRTSFVCSKGYRKSFCEKTSDLITELEELETNWSEKFRFGLQYLPLSAIRERAEFHLAHSLFKETYQLPEDFNFAAYLSGCFDRYALKTINRSMFTWFVLMMLGIMNYCRIKAGYGFHHCHEPAPTDDAPVHRRYLNDVHDPGDEVSSTSHAVHMVTVSCYVEDCKFFVFCALLLVIYTSVIVFISRVYKLRLINRIGFNGPEDYLGFLQFAEEEVKSEQDARVTSAALKKEIDNVLDADEHHGEEDEFREVGEFLSRSFTTLGEVFQDCVLAIKLAVIAFVNPARVTKNENTPTILSLKSHEADEPSTHTEDGKETDLSTGDGDDSASGRRHSGGSEQHGSEDHNFSRKRIMSKLTSTMRGKSVKFRNSLLQKGSPTPRHSVSPVDTSAQSKDGGDDAKSNQERLAAAVAASNTTAPMVVQRRTMTSRMSMHHRPHHLHADDELPANSPIMEFLQKIKVPDVAEENQFVVSSNSGNNSQHNSGHNNEAFGIVDAAAVSPSRVAPDKHAKRHTFVKKLSSHEFAHPHNNNNNNNNSFHNNEITSNDSSSEKHIALLVPVAKGVPRRNSIHVKRPEHNLSTIEKFHMDHPVRETHHVIDMRLLNQVIANSKAKKEKSSASACWDQIVVWTAQAIAGCAGLCRSNKVTDGNKEEQKNGGNGHHGGGGGRGFNECDLSDDFSDIYFFGKPLWFFRAVELCIMFNCLYLALWVTNFIKIATELDISISWQIITQICMAIPFIVVIPAIGFIAKTSSLLTAISELNLEVVQEVLVETEDTNVLLDELRRKMLERIESITTVDMDKMQIIHGLFAEIDQDGSGSIDKIEFRVLLRALKLTYSDQRFKRLYRAVDSDGDNKIRRAELDQFLNPEGYKLQEEERRRDKVQARKEKQLAEQRALYGDNVEDGSFILDADSNAVYASSAGANVMNRKLRSLSSMEEGEYSDTDSEGDASSPRRRHRLSALPKVDSASHLEDNDHSGHKSAEGDHDEGRHGRTFSFDHAPSPELGDSGDEAV